MEEFRINNGRGQKRPNILREKSYSFAVRIVSLARRLKEQKTEAVLVNQMLRSGTSISANVEEANAAISRAEFSAKLSIAFKEARETQFWINLLKDSESLSIKNHASINNDCDEILRLLWAILKKTRMKNQ
jgi:four helix bundle protein